MKGVSKEFSIAQQIRLEEANLTINDMQSLSTLESGISIMTLEEVISTLKFGEESALFQLKIKRNSYSNESLIDATS
jgi:hypothetical protein